MATDNDTDPTPAPAHLIPAPVRTGGEGRCGFVFDPSTTITAAPGTETTERWLRTTLGAAFGLPLAPGANAEGGEPAANGERATNTVRLALDPALEPEGYRLGTGTGTGVEITGGSPAGVFWGAQTLRQLLGPEAFRRAPVRPGARRAIPFTDIEDSPRFPWRGMMLDVARHFMAKDDVLRYLDLLAAHKLNVFHFHLTDDQGWRIEIKRYPRLTEIGSWRSRTKHGHRASELWDETPHGGYYTQDDIREIVAYAAERHIRVVPEIDIPGHSQAAIAAYPELGNADVVDTAALTVWDTWGINANVLAPTDNTLRFFESVLEEVLDLFPAATSPFIHIGGDECRKEQWKESPVAQARIEEFGLANEDELQSWIIRHFDAWLTARGQPADRLGRDPGGRPPGGRRRVVLAGLRRRHRRRRGGPRRRHVPGAARVPGPPSARRPRRADAHRLRPHPGGRLPLRTRTGGPLRGGGPSHPGHPGQCLDRGDAEPGPRRLPGLPAPRGVRGGRVVAAARLRRAGLRGLRAPDGHALRPT